MKHLFAALLWVVVQPLGCLDGETSRPLGGSCTDDDLCEGLLVCQYGRCRALCEFDRDCEPDGYCLPSEGEGSAGVCLPAGELDCACVVGEPCESCPEGLLCGPSGICGGICEDHDECPEGWACRDTEGVCQPCTPSCEDRQCGSDGCTGDCGICTAGHSCLDETGRCVLGTYVMVEGESFWMGSEADEPGREGNETRHEVTLTTSYWMQTTEVTQGQYETLMEQPSPSVCTSDGTGCTCTGECPLENVTWHGAATYANGLSEMAGLPLCYECSGDGAATVCALSPELTLPCDCAGFRLPTEAEWERAARAGTTTATYNGDLPEVLECADAQPVLDPIAWNRCVSGHNTTVPVGSLAPNDLGLYDMLGNVEEWCHDGYADDLGTAPVTDPAGTGDPDEAHRVTRGGSYHEPLSELRAAWRGARPPAEDQKWVGFRVVRTARW